MVTIDYSSDDFIKDKYLFLDNYFYKLVDSSSKKVIDTIIANKAKLSLSNYSIPEEYCLTKDGRLCYRTKILEDYKTLDTLIYLNMYLDPEKIATSLAKIYMELKSIGVNYADFHPGNILLDKDSNVVLVDLDGAALSKDEDNYFFSARILIGFVLQIITYGERFIDFGPSMSFDFLVAKYHPFDVYDKKVRKTIYKICNYKAKLKKIDYVELFKKLCEEDKVREIKRLVYS